MRRLIAIALVGAGVFLAYRAPAPVEAEPPVFDAVVAVAAEAAAGNSIWYCAVAEATAESNGIVGLVTLEGQVATVTIPSPFPGEPPTVTDVDLEGPSAFDLTIADMILQGQSPSFVEFPTGPASASTLSVGAEGVSGDLCVSSAPKEWHLPGGTTRSGATMILRLFNPFPENAKVTVTGSSELGSVPLPDFDSIDVPARSWVSIDLTTEVPFLDDLALRVSSEIGLVMPSVILDFGGDRATWTGTALSMVWEFPSAGAGGLDAVIVVTNPGDVVAEVVVDAYTTEGPIPGTASFSVEPSRPLRISVGDFVTGPAGIRLTATRPVAAVVVAESVVEGIIVEGQAPPDPEPGNLAATVGAVAPAKRWLVSGLGSEPGRDSSLWILNSGGEASTVVLLPLGEVSREPIKVSLPAGSIRRVPAQSSVAAGYVVESTSPITVAWVAVSENGVAYLAGAAIQE